MRPKAPFANQLMRAADSPHWNATPSRDPLGDFFQGAYVVVSAVIGVATFVGCWIYCVATYGFLLGVSLGWFPAAIMGLIAFLAWPLAALVVWWFMANGGR